MKIDFGIVRKYCTDEGFGFVGHTFFDTHPNELFHIRTIKRTNPELARRLNNPDSKEAVYFWYEFKEGQVAAVLDLKNINQKYNADLNILIAETECIWRDLNEKLPDRFDEISLDIMGIERTNELRAERDSFELRRKNIKENKRREVETLRKIEDEKIQKKIEDDEFEQLIADMTPLGFTSSKQLSSYIMKNDLGNKYKNISGVVKMEKEGKVWSYNGAFPQNIYANICSELGLGNEGTNAKVVGFNSFKELNKKK